MKYRFFPFRLKFPATDTLTYSPFRASTGLAWAALQLW